MNHNQYFQQLRQVFKNHPYQDRFLQELQDHAHDLELELPNSKKLNLNEMKKQFGDPKQVKETFTQITRPWKKWLEAGEVFLYGILMIFWVEASEMLEFVAYYRVPFFVELMTVILFLFLPYPFIYKKLFSEKDRIFSRSLSVFLMMIPLIFFIFLQAIELFIFFKSRSPFPITDHYITFAGISIVMGLATHWTWNKDWPWVKKIKSKFPKRIIPNWLDFLIFLYIASFFAFRLMATYSLLEYKSLFGVRLRNIIFTPIEGLYSGLFYTLPSSFQSSIISYYVLFIILLGVCISSLFFVTKKRFSWSILSFAVFPFIFIWSSAIGFNNLPKIDSEFEYVDVSELIVQEQIKIFPSIYEHVASDQSLLYMLENNDQGIYIKQEGSSEVSRKDLLPKMFLAEFNDSNLLEIEVSKVRRWSESLGQFERFDYQWPKGFYCDGPDLGVEIRRTCFELFYEEKTLIKNNINEDFTVQDLVFLEDLGLTMVVFSQGRGSFQLYLFDLNSLDE